VAAGRSSPALQTLTITVPRYLRLASRRGVSVSDATARHTRIRFTDHAAHGTTLTIMLREATHSMRVRLAPPSLRAAGGQVQAAALQTGSRVPLTLSVTDANSGQSKLTRKVTIGT